MDSIGEHSVKYTVLLYTLYWIVTSYHYTYSRAKLWLPRSRNAIQTAHVTLGETVFVNPQIVAKAEEQDEEPVTCGG